MMKTLGYATHSPTDKLQPFTFERRDPRPEDVVIDILYCGICHSDIHSARNEWGWTQYPFVPGHEIVGRVRAVGDKVSRFKPGDLVGVGCLVDSCRHCEACEDGLEQLCENGLTGTYGGEDKIGGTPSTTLVASNRPPIPVSSNVTSALKSANNLKPSAVINSKYVMDCP